MYNTDMTFQLKFQTEHFMAILTLKLFFESALKLLMLAQTTLVLIRSSALTTHMLFENGFAIR